MHRTELARNGVRMLKGVEYRRIDAAGVHHRRRKGDAGARGYRDRVCGTRTGNGVRPHSRKFHLIGGAREATELDAKRAMLEGAELAAEL